RASMQMQIDEGTRTAQAKLDEANHRAEVKSTTLRKKVAALQAELDLAQHEAKLERGRAREEMESLKSHSTALAEDVVADRLAEAQTAADQRLQAEVERTQTDAHQTELAAAARLVDSIRAIDNARSLGDVLTALAASAGREV